MSKKQEWLMMPLMMSWDQPIGQEILKFVRSMKRDWATQRSTWGHVNKAAKIYVSAYETVEKHIEKEIRLRDQIKEKES